MRRLLGSTAVVALLAGAAPVFTAPPPQANASQSATQVRVFEGPG